MMTMTFRCASCAICWICAGVNASVNVLHVSNRAPAEMQSLREVGPFMIPSCPFYFDTAIRSQNHEDHGSSPHLTIPAEQIASQNASDWCAYPRDGDTSH